jgi:hypothetical protein
MIQALMSTTGATIIPPAQQDAVNKDSVTVPGTNVTTGITGITGIAGNITGTAGNLTGTAGENIPAPPQPRVRPTADQVLHSYGPVYTEFSLDQWDNFLAWELRDHVDGNFYHAPITSLVYHTAFNSNRKTDMILRRQSDMLNQKRQNDLDVLNRRHARELNGADEKRVHELDQAKRKRRDMKAK